MQQFQNHGVAQSQYSYKAYSQINSVNTAMQVRRYQQTQSQIVP